MTADSAIVDQARDDLKLVLHQLAPAIAHLSDGFVALRQAVLDRDIEHFLLLTAEQEEASAHVAHLDRQRQRLQRQLEHALDVSGLAGVLAPAEDADEPDQLLETVDGIRWAVRRVREEESRTAMLLNAVIDLTRRARLHLSRQIGAETSYGFRVSGFELGLGTQNSELETQNSKLL